MHTEDNITSLQQHLFLHHLRYDLGRLPVHAHLLEARQEAAGKIREPSHGGNKCAQYLQIYGIAALPWILR